MSIVQSIIFNFIVFNLIFITEIIQNQKEIREGNISFQISH